MEGDQALLSQNVERTQSRVYLQEQQAWAARGCAQARKEAEINEVERKISKAEARRIVQHMRESLKWISLKSERENPRRRLHWNFLRNQQAQAMGGCLNQRRS